MDIGHSGISSSVRFHVFAGKATISNDGATIMKLLNVVHPAAKTLVDIAKSQDAEVSGHMAPSNQLSVRETG